MQIAAGEALDKIGAWYGVPRKIEPDAEYRERIHRAGLPWYLPGKRP